MAQRKTLVVVFSMGGNTHRVGEQVAHALGGHSHWLGGRLRRWRVWPSFDKLRTNPVGNRQVNKTGSS